MSAQGEDLSLKVLQLECIIDSKNRELQLLREHLSEDQEDAIQQLQEENGSLKEQLSKYTVPQCSADGRAPHAAAASVTSDLKRAAKDVAEQVMHSSEAVDYLMYVLQQAEKAATVDAGTAQADGHIAKSSVDRLVQLNVSGKHMVVPLSVLQQVPGSRLSTMFTAGSPEQQQLLVDADGRHYLPYEPEAFSRIVSVLQARSLFGSSSSSGSGSSSADSYYLQPPHAYGQQQQQQAAAAGEPLSSSWNYITDLINLLSLQSLLNPDDRTAAAAAVGGSSSSTDGALIHEPIRSYDPAAAAAAAKAAAASTSSGQQQQQQQPDGSGIRRANSSAAAAAKKGSGRHNPPDITEDTRYSLPSDNVFVESLTAPPAAAAAAVTAALFALPAKHPTAAPSDGSSKLAAAAAAEPPTAAAADPVAFAAVQQALQPRQSWSDNGSDDTAAAAAAAEVAAARQH